MRKRPRLEPVTRYIRFIAASAALLATILCGRDEGGDEGTGEPRDLAPFARLLASDTEPTSPFPWPREDEDAIATIRDDVPDNGWKAPAGRESWVEIDLQPWIGRAVSLSSIVIEYDGAKPRDAKVDLLEGCGGRVIHSLAWKDTDSKLRLGGRSAGCVLVRLLAPEKTSITKLELRSRDPEVSLPQAKPEDMERPQRIFHNYGVAEGFYGNPWSWREREHMIASMAANGLDTYIYAPKNDKLHRADWREPYPEEEMKRFDDLNRFARQLGVTFFFGISPMMDFSFETDEDFNILASKLEAFAAMGIDAFVLLADDIEFGTGLKLDGTLGGRHSDAANRLLARLREAAQAAKLWFVPSIYSNSHFDSWPGGEDYMKALRELDPEIEVIWTGTGTSSATMTSQDLERCTALTGRKPLIWDNFYANDVGNAFFGSILLGAFSGRGPDLPAAVNGITHNLSVQGAVSRLALSTFGYYLQNPSDQDQDKAIERAASIEPAFSCGAAKNAGHEKDLLAFIMKLFNGNSLQMPRFVEMNDAIAALSENLEFSPGVPAAAASSLLPMFGRMVSARSEAHHSGLETDLADQLFYPLRKAKFEGETGLWTLALLGERLAGRAGQEEEEKARAAVGESGNCRFVLGSEDTSKLLDRVDAFEPEDRGFEPIEISRPDPPRCRTGEEFAWKPFAEADRVEVFGLPAATVSNGEIRWTAGHSGRYEGVATALKTGGEPGWRFLEFTLICVK